MAAGVRSNGRRQVSIEVGITRSRDVPPQVRWRPASGFMRSKRQSTMASRGTPSSSCMCPRRSSLVHHESQLNAVMYELHPLQSPHGIPLYWGQRAVRSRGASSWPWSTSVLPYESQILHFRTSRKQQSPHMLKPQSARTGIPVPRTAMTCIDDPVACCTTWTSKYRLSLAPIFGADPRRNPGCGGLIVRVISPSSWPTT